MKRNERRSWVFFFENKRNTAPAARVRLNVPATLCGEDEAAPTRTLGPSLLRGEHEELGVQDHAMVSAEDELLWDGERSRLAFLVGGLLALGRLGLVVLGLFGRFFCLGEVLATVARCTA